MLLFELCDQTNYIAPKFRLQTSAILVDSLTLSPCNGDEMRFAA